MSEKNNNHRGIGGDFMTKYMELNGGTEIPPLFALWSGIGALSCVLKRQCWLDMGTYKVFPNLFILLVASSGRCRKSTSIRVMKKLVHAMTPSPNMISQKITPEALIHAVKATPVDPEDGVVPLEEPKDSAAFVLADEFSTFLNRRSYDAGIGEILIEFFDCEDPFKYTTRKDGEIVVPKSCLGILAASTADWLRTAIPEAAIGGGLTSRMIFVYVDKPPRPVAWTEFSIEKQVLEENLILDLERISKVKGRMGLSPKGKDWFVHWYEKVWRDDTGVIGSGARFFDDMELAGYASRRHVHLLKLGMLFASTEYTKTVEIKHLVLADQLLESTEKHLFKVISLISQTENNKIEYVKNKIMRHKILPLSELIRETQRKVTHRELIEALQSLEAGGQIKRVMEGSSTLIQRLDLTEE